jgi:membrane-associated phospholipid phosphatase
MSHRIDDHRKRPPRWPLVVAGALALGAAGIAPFEHAWTGPAMKATYHALQPVQDYVDIGGAFGATTGIVLITLLVVALDRRWRDHLPTIVPGVFVLGIINGALKLVFRRQRPMWDSDRDFLLSVPDQMAGHWFVTPHPAWTDVFDQRYLSFPSGHSAAAAFLAAALSSAYPRGRYVWWGLAILCMVSRFEGARHYGADCLAGAAVGIVVWWLSARFEVYAPLSRALKRWLPDGTTSHSPTQRLRLSSVDASSS